MRSLLSILIAFILIYPSFLLGQIFDQHSRKPTEIANNCAYYDMESGDFTWGAKPIVMSFRDAQDFAAPPAPEPKKNLKLVAPVRGHK